MIAVWTFEAGVWQTFLLAWLWLATAVIAFMAGVHQTPHPRKACPVCDQHVEGYIKARDGVLVGGVEIGENRMMLQPCGHVVSVSSDIARAFPFSH